MSSIRAYAHYCLRTIVEDLRTAKMPAADLVEPACPKPLTYHAFPDIHWQKIRTTDEIDKPFLLDLLFWSSTGDRVAKSRPEDVSPAAQPSPSLLMAALVCHFSGQRGCHRLTNCS